MYTSGGGYSVSDEILDEGRTGLSFFADFIPVYDEAAALAGPGRYRGITFPGDIQRPFDELRGIDFRTMWNDGEHLVSAVENSGRHLDALDKYWGSLSGWTGAASEAAKTHHDRFNDRAADFVKKAAPAGGAIMGGVTNIQSTVSEYSQAVFGMYSETCGGMTPQDVRGAIELAKGNVDSSNAQYFLAKAGDVTAGFLTFGATWLLDYFGWGMSDMVRQQLMDAAKQRLRTFVQEFDAKKGSYDRLTRVALQSIQQDYDTMLSAMRPMTEDAFRDLPDAQPTGSTTPAGTTQQPVGARRPPTVPGGGTTPSGARPPSGTGTVQRPPTIPGAGGPQQTVPSGSIPTVPQQVPQIPGQQPGTLPGQQPGGLPGQRPGQPVTIPNGNGTITVSPPDASGRVRLSVSDGNGPPKTYDLDFGRGGTVSSGAGTLPTGGPQPLPPMTQPGGGSVPGAPPPFGGMPGIPPVGGSRPGAPGSPGSTPKLPPSMFPFSDKPAQQVHPDEQGHMVIHDGDATITVDANEAADKLTITVDDGHGHKTSYQLDYHDPAHPTLKEGPPVEPHLFGPTGSTPSTPHFAPGGYTPEHASAHGFGGGGGGGAGLAAAASPGGGAGGAGGQLQPGAYTGGQVAAQPAGQTGAAAAAPGGAGQPGGGPSGGMPMMGGMGAGGGQRGEDQERGPNRWLGKENTFNDDPNERRKAMKAGGVIGEDKKK